MLGWYWKRSKLTNWFNWFRIFQPNPNVGWWAFCNSIRHACWFAKLIDTDRLMHISMLSLIYTPNRNIVILKSFSSLTATVSLQFVTVPIPISCIPRTMTSWDKNAFHIYIISCHFSSRNRLHIWMIHVTYLDDIGYISGRWLNICTMRVTYLADSYISGR